MKRVADESNGNTEHTCWACQTPLKRRQKICLECESWQNWRKYLSISNATLGLLVALIAVTSALLPNLVKLGTRDLKRFDLISGSVTSSEDNRVTIQLKVLNSGNINVITPLLIFCYSAVEPNEDSKYIMSVKAEENFEFHSSERELVMPNEITTVEYYSADVYQFGTSDGVNPLALLCQFPYWDANETTSNLNLLVISNLVLGLEEGDIIFN